MRLFCVTVPLCTLQTQDPTEHEDLNSVSEATVAISQLVERMVDRIRAINATAFSPHRGMPSPLGCQVAVEKYVSLPLMHSRQSRVTVAGVVS